MARLIDADALENELGEVWGIPADWDGGMDEKCETAFTVIGNQPTVDAVEVVRCKDCRHKDFRYYDKESVFCYMSAKYRHINDFCSYGAKMDGGDK